MTPIDPSPAAGGAAPLSRIHALIQLLGDENERVWSAAREHLAGLGAAVLPHLEAAADGAEDLRVRARARSFLREHVRHAALDRWADFCRRGAPDLEEGTLLLAGCEYSTADLSPVRRRLDEYAAVVRGRIATARRVETAVQTLVQFLRHEQGFRGERSGYSDPEASYVNRVLETRRGIPVSLAAVYLLVARRVDVPLLGVGMPQHFLLKYVEAADRSEAFVDPFHGEMKLGQNDCRRFLELKGIPFETGFLRAVSDREILSRMLGNLLRLYHARGDERRLNRTHAMLRHLEQP